MKKGEPADEHVCVPVFINVPQRAAILKKAVNSGFQAQLCLEMYLGLKSDTHLIQNLVQGSFQADQQFQVRICPRCPALAISANPERALSA